MVSKDIPFAKIKPMAMSALKRVGIVELADRRAGAEPREVSVREPP